MFAGFAPSVLESHSANRMIIVLDDFETESHSYLGTGYFHSCPLYYKHHTLLKKQTNKQTNLLGYTVIRNGRE